MANQLEARPIGKPKMTIQPSKASVPPSTIEPLPYFPNLKSQLRGVTASLVLTYLEIHHPAPRDSNGTILAAPVTLDLDAVAADLQVSRRTLCVTLSVLCTWWPTEKARSSAARAGREFLNPDHTRYGRWKFYSATGSKTWRVGSVIRLRRNFAALACLLQEAGIPTLAVPVPVLAFPIPKLADGAVSASASFASCKKESQVEILLRGSVLSGDRRSTRYPRLRAAVEAGLAPARVLKVRRNGGKHLSETGNGNEPGSR